MLFGALKPISINIMKLNRYTKVGGIAVATLFLVVMSFFNPGIIVLILVLKKMVKRSGFVMVQVIVKPLKLVIQRT